MLVCDGGKGGGVKKPRLSYPNLPLISKQRIKNKGKSEDISYEEKSVDKNPDKNNDVVKKLMYVIDAEA